MKAKIVKDTNRFLLSITHNNKQWSSIRLENPTEDAIVIREVLNDFIKFGTCEKE